MTNRINLVLALPLAVLLACGTAQAQLRAPTGTQPKEGLGSGLGAPSAPQSQPAQPASPPAGTTSAPASEAPASPEAVVQEIADCVLPGLPPDWALAQIEVREIGRSDKQRDFEAIYTYKDTAGKAGPFAPCDLRGPAQNVYRLNGALEPAKRNWTRATLVLSKEGKFELQYDYTAPEPAKDAKPSKPAAADAKKDAARSSKKK